MRQTTYTANGIHTRHAAHLRVHLAAHLVHQIRLIHLILVVRVELIKLVKLLQCMKIVIAILHAIL